MTATTCGSHAGDGDSALADDGEAAVREELIRNYVLEDTKSHSEKQLRARCKALRVKAVISRSDLAGIAMAAGKEPAVRRDILVGRIVDAMVADPDTLPVCSSSEI